MKSLQSSVELRNGVRMPWLGLGVFRSAEGGEVEQAVRWALERGYRSIDTASAYGNEQGVGKAVRESRVPREEVFLTTKVWNSDQGYERTLAAFEASLARLAVDYVDLYLVHWPVPGKFLDTWRALETIYDQGRARAIGVSNFLEHHLLELMGLCRIAPMVNQVEFHPRLVQKGLAAFCQERDVRMEAWSPLMKGRIMEVPEIVDLARKYARTPAQITLRWDLQHGYVTIPKSTRKTRIEENGQIFDFALSEEDVAVLDSLDRGERLGPDPDHFHFGF